MTNPLTNATLTRILTPGAPDRYGDPAPPTATWTGRAPGYLKRANRTVLSGGQQIQLKRDLFIILDTAGAPTSEAAGPDWAATLIDIEDQRTSPPVTRRYRVQAVEHRAVGSPLDSTRLELTSEQDAT